MSVNMGGRRLTAILAADVAGYSALMAENEIDTVAALKGHQSIILPMIVGFAGRVIDTAGDGVLAEFSSVLNAVKCAIAIQETMLERNASVVPDRRIQFRIGINQGDVLFDDDRIFGDGINVASRLEGLCEPGGICISGKVYEEIKSRFQIRYEDLGPQTLKNIAEPVQAYRISVSSAPASRTTQSAKSPLRNSLYQLTGTKQGMRRSAAAALVVAAVALGVVGTFLLAPRLSKAPAPQLSLQVIDERIWSDVASTGTVEAITQYLQRFPDGHHVADAQRLLKKTDESAWADAADVGTTTAFARYLSQFPQGAHGPQAKARIAELEHQAVDDGAWSTALIGGSKEAFNEYLKAYPSGIHVAEASARISEINASRSALCKVRYPAALSAIPAPNTLSCKQVVMVLDGTCEPGAIKRVVAGCSEQNIPTQTFCVACDPSFGRFGINFSVVTQEIANRLNLPQPRGILLRTVNEKGPAGSAGIRPGDVIVMMDGKELKENDDLYRIIGATPAGKKIDVVIIRDGKELTLPVTLAR
jgi:class 3 adenylate cyclase